MNLSDEKLVSLRQGLQEHSEERVATDDARNLIRFIELLIEADKKSNIIRDEFRSSK